ncbi:MAG: glycosyltransferase [Leptospirales bacterium]
MAEANPAGSRPISVCHLFPSLPLHGAENHFLKLCRNLDPTLVRTSILLIVEGGELVPDFEALGIPVTIIPKKSRYDLSVVPRIRRFLKSGNFDIVHTHLFTANFWGRLAAMGLPSILVSSAHNVVARERPFLVRVENFLDRLLSVPTDAIFCVTGQVMQSMEKDAGLPRHKLVTIENGLSFSDHPDVSAQSARSRLDLSTGIPVLAVIGRFSTQKNHPGFLEALDRVRKRYPDVVALLVGEGELEPVIREMARSRGLSDNLRFLGQRRDVPEILRALDLLVVPSLWEGLPNVMLEAMAAGIPVVATRVGGIPDVLTDRLTGVLCEPSPKSLSEGMLWALGHPDRMSKMADASVSLIRDRYDIRNTARRYTGFYRNLVRQKSFHRGAKDTLRRGVGRMFSRRSGKSANTLRVLMYHRVSEDPGQDILSVTPFAFAEQMRWLHEEGYRVLAVEEALSHLDAGTLPKQSVAITFDDGYRDNYEEAFPVLARYRMPAMVFPVTGFVLGEGEHPRYRNHPVPVPYLTIDQIRLMKKAGIDFGCHTHTHALLSRISPEEAVLEIRQAKKLLEEWTGGTVRMFAYPNGLFLADHFRMLEALGFDAAFSVQAGTNRPGQSRWRLRRTEISGRDSLGDFISKMLGGLDLWHGLYQGVRGFYR